MSNIALFQINFNFNIIGIFCPLSIILTIAIPEISSTNGVSIGINFFSAWFYCYLFSWEYGYRPTQESKT